MDHKKLDITKEKGKNGLATFLFSRIFIFGLMIALQLACFLLLAYNASVNKVFSYVIIVVQVLLVIYIVNDKSDNEINLGYFHYACPRIWRINVLVREISAGFH